MTHRSRSGGPGPQQKGRKALAKKKRGPRLNHPPAAPGGGSDGEGEGEAEGTAAAADGDNDDESDEEEAEDAGVLPARVFRASPTNQAILNALDHAIRYDERFGEHVQRAKALLFERRWLDLFLDAGLLDAYAGRWVPSRALMFRAVMAECRPIRALFSRAPENTGTPEPEPVRILSLGGGAGSELLAVAGLCVPARAAVRWTGVDIGDWGSVVTRIADAVGDWELPAHFEFVEADVLKLPLSDAPKPTPKPKPGAAEPAAPSADPAEPATATTMTTTTPTPLPAWLQLRPALTTLCFTLTELLSQSRPRTINLLRHVTAATPVGGLLLVLDSASDIAEFPLGSGARTWPVHMIADALLLGLAVPKGAWRKVRSDDSRWFRLDGTERWGRCKLENGRYWLRLYERC